MSIAAILIAIPDNEPPADLEALIAAAGEGARHPPSPSPINP